MNKYDAWIDIDNTYHRIICNSNLKAITNKLQKKYDCIEENLFEKLSEVEKNIYSKNIFELNFLSENNFPEKRKIQLSLPDQI